MITDAHHHLWEFNPEEYGWIDDSMEILKQDYLPGRLEVLLQKAGVEGTVVVQARQTLQETRWLLRLAAEFEFIKGVVGWVDLKSEDPGKQLDEFRDNPLLVGLRHVIQDEPDDDFMLADSFLRGIEALGKYGLAYDLLILPRHLKNAVELVSMFPGQKFVLDHLAKPFIREGMLEPWKGDLEALAQRTNVWCKISGMVTEADVKNWKYGNFEPYLDVAFGAFGADRLMIGSDWPVCSLAGNYEEILEIPRRYFGALDPVSQEKIFRNNAINFYELSIR